MTNDLVAQPAFADAAIASLPLSLRLIADESTYARVWAVAKAMAKSPGLVPPHLIGKDEACFSVVVASLEWRQNPMMVARCTYQTPGGGVGFFGKLCRSIAESSGHLSKPIQYEFYGEWEKVQGKFTMAESQKKDDYGNAKKYAKATYTSADETGVGVRVIFHMKGEDEPRTFDFDLRQAHPRNSVMWATDPKTQIMYTATRRAIDAVAPHLLLGMPFEDEYPQNIGPDRARDVTPPPGPDPILAMIGIEKQQEDGDVPQLRPWKKRDLDLGIDVKDDEHRYPIALVDGQVRYFADFNTWCGAYYEAMDESDDALKFHQQNHSRYTRISERHVSDDERASLNKIAELLSEKANAEPNS